MGFGIHIHLNLSPELKWVGNAVKTAGKPIGAVAHAVQGAEGAVGKEIGKLPVIGKPLHAIFDLGAMGILGPALTLGNVLGGERIDQAILGTLKQELQDVKAIAPYAEMVIAFVPGIGPGVAGALGAGLALASGQSLTQAMEEGIKDAIPGGAIAVAIYQVSKTAVSIAKKGGRVTLGDVVALGGAAAQAVGFLPEGVQTAIQGVIGPVSDAVQGVSSAVQEAETAMGPFKNLVSAEAKKALQIGISVGHGKFLQQAGMQGLTDPGLRNRLMAQGQQVAASDPTVQAARSTLQAGFNGFDVGVGLMRMSVTPHQFQTIRGMLQGPDQVGFDLATSLHIARVSQPTPALGSTPANAGYLATLGMQGAPDASKTAIMQGIATQPVIAGGAKAAVSHVAERRASWWARIVSFFTGQKHVLA
jgi:hypothetical protein